VDRYPTILRARGVNRLDKSVVRRPLRRNADLDLGPDAHALVSYLNLPTWPVSRATLSGAHVALEIWPPRRELFYLYLLSHRAPGRALSPLRTTCRRPGKSVRGRIEVGDRMRPLGRVKTYAPSMREKPGLARPKNPNNMPLECRASSQKLCATQTEAFFTPDKVGRGHEAAPNHQYRNVATASSEADRLAPGCVSSGLPRW